MALVDRIGLGLFVLAAILFLILGLLSPDGRAFDAGWWDALFTVGLKAVLPIWLVLRVIDWVFGGHARRRSHTSMRS